QNGQREKCVRDNEAASDPTGSADHGQRSSGKQSDCYKIACTEVIAGKLKDALPEGFRQRNPVLGPCLPEPVKVDADSGIVQYPEFIALRKCFSPEPLDNAKGSGHHCIPDEDYKENNGKGFRVTFSHS